MSLQDIVSILEKTLGTDAVQIIEQGREDYLLVDKESLLAVCEIIYQHDQLYFDFLSSITASDNGEESGMMDVIYHFSSLVYELKLTLKVVLDRTQPEIQSLCSIWKAANWHEREAYDLLGVKFLNHPDLRRILLPHNWEGHPLRKDYDEQEYYHGIKVKY